MRVVGKHPHCELSIDILDIADLRTSDRIDFIGGICGLGELKKRVDSGEMKAAFALYPVSMKQLIDIADSGNIMPPKTTWFEPKLRSGLVIHKLELKLLFSQRNIVHCSCQLQ